MVPLGPNTVNRYMTTTMEETAAVAVVEAVVVGMVGTAVAVGHHSDLPGENIDTGQEAGGSRGLTSMSEKQVHVNLNKQ